MCFQGCRLFGWLMLCSVLRGSVRYSGLTDVSSGFVFWLFRVLVNVVTSVFGR